jgi:hypothetical protein
MPSAWRRNGLRTSAAPTMPTECYRVTPQNTAMVGGVTAQSRHTRQVPAGPDCWGRCSTSKFARYNPLGFWPPAHLLTPLDAVARDNEVLPPNQRPKILGVLVLPTLTGTPADVCGDGLPAGAPPVRWHPRNVLTPASLALGRCAPPGATRRALRAPRLATDCRLAAGKPHVLRRVLPDRSGRQPTLNGEARVAYCQLDSLHRVATEN